MISFSTSQNDGSPKFALGQIVGTPQALASIEDSGQSPAELLDRHVSGDAEDDEGNRAATTILLPSEY